MLLPDGTFILTTTQQGRRVIIFYGSQTGTAEDYASRLAKEIKSRFNVAAVVVDTEQVDMKYLDQFPEDAIAIFVMSTYGEGEPTDNAVPFWDLLHDPSFSEDSGDHPLTKLRYFIFGLGNSTYTYFNQASKTVDEKLTSLGATRLGERGEGDDDKSLEDDFLAWQEKTWPIFADALGADESDAGNSQAHDPAYIVAEHASEFDGNVYQGELGDQSQSHYDAKKPYPATITSRDLLHNSDRHCLHLEIDIANSGLSYTTGDHVAIWPTNSEVDVARLASVLGLQDKLDTVISVKPADEAATKIPFPQPTSYRAMFRHYLDICSPPSRQVLSLVAPYCPTPEASEVLKTLATDKDKYQHVVAGPVRNLAEVLAYAAPSTTYAIPPGILIEALSRLQPRYYSISSSSIESPNNISVTAVTLRYHPEPTPERTIFGVNTNYLWAVHSAVHAEDKSECLSKHAVQGPGGKYFDKQANVAKLPIHVRRSNFKLPANEERPIIMIGPGTGVAPFRGFVRERAYLKKQGKNVGPTILFFGCRRSTEDFLYQEEWPELFDTLGAPSRIITAFSRETDKKVYVQDKLRENGKEMWELIRKSGATIYICGEAKRMARDVYRTFVDLAQQYGGMDEQAAIDFMTKLKSNNRYQEDVWA